MARSLKESRDRGLSRIEITYTAESYDAEQELFKDQFIERATQDLDLAMMALN